MDPQVLIDRTSAAPMPAPIWFIELFKVLGFVLHLVPMNLWFAGLLVALYLHARGSVPGQRFASRLLTQMPVIVALGINLGIVPLLFLQLAYNKVFYPATILMAWFWMGVIVLLIPAYYGVYDYMFGVRSQRPFTLGRRAHGWVAAGLFITIGLLFTNAMTLTAHVQRWPGLWASHSVAGAATGTALNLADPSVWPRWLMVFGLALGTTAAWSLVDAAWFGRRESPDYQSWIRGFARHLYVASFAWTFVCGAVYIATTWNTAAWTMLISFPMVLLTLLTAVAPALPMAWLLWRRQQPLTRLEASLVGLGQVGVLAVNAISRQIVQNAELASVDFRVLEQPTSPQWGPLVTFLVVFVAGLGVIAWILLQVVRVETADEPQA